MNKFDYVVIGAGVIGLALARRLIERNAGSVLVLEKESRLGMHASGRNSGVLHSGVYYAPDSLKARFCSIGARRMREYANQKGIRIETTGKVIVAVDESDLPELESLFVRAHANGVRVEKLDETALRRIEPEAATRRIALHAPDTAVIDADGVLGGFESDLLQAGAQIRKNEQVMSMDGQGRVFTKSERYQAGHVINAAGLWADRIAHSVGVGMRYRILPFKGVYRRLTSEAAQRFRGAIYPVPRKGMPFLGTHVTRGVNGEVYIGPTAIPALGREQYHGFRGLSPNQSLAICADLFRMWWANNDRFRDLVREETSKYQRTAFVRSARLIAPGLTARDFASAGKVGIRAQLVDVQSMRLTMDYVIEKGPRSTHVLNAVSPAFTSSLPFAEHVVDQYVLS